MITHLDSNKCRSPFTVHSKVIELLSWNSSTSILSEVFGKLLARLGSVLMWQRLEWRIAESWSKSWGCDYITHPFRGRRTMAVCTVQQVQYDKLQYISMQKLNHFPLASIFLKSSCPFFGWESDNVGTSDDVGATSFRICPNPALGLDFAALGTNNPLGAAPECEVPSSESFNVTPLNTIGSGSNSSFPASWKCMSHGCIYFDYVLTATFWNSTTASFFSTRTSTREIWARFSRTCWRSPSCVPGGKLWMRRDRVRISACFPKPLSGSLVKIKDQPSWITLPYLTHRLRDRTRVSANVTAILRFFNS